MDPLQLVAVAAVVAGGSLLGGISGFGYGLVAAPLLLVVGVPLPSIVVLNLGLGIVTRGLAAWRLRRDVSRNAAFLIAGSVPGYALGTALLSGVDGNVLEVATGVVVIVLALLSLLRRESAFVPGPRSLVVTGVAGGTLGASTSLNGVVPALVLSQARLSNRQFIADLGVYFVGSSVVGLVAVTLAGISAPNAWLLFAVSVPLSVAANQLGLTLGTRLPPKVFRALTIVVVICAGVAAIVF